MAEYVTAQDILTARIQKAAEAMAAHDYELNGHQEPLDFYEALAEVAAKVLLGR